MAEKDVTALRKITDVLIDSLSQHYSKRGVEWKKINICKRSRDLKDGELVIPLGSTSKIVEQTFHELQEEIKAALSKIDNVDLPVANVDSDKYNLARFHIHRPKAFLNVIRQVETRKEKYGRAELKTQRHVLLNMADFQSLSDEEIVLTPAHLRYIVILQHVACLLEANGHQVEAVPVKQLVQFNKVCSCLQFTNTISTVCAATSNGNVVNSNTVNSNASNSNTVDSNASHSNEVNSNASNSNTSSSNTSNSSTAINNTGNSNALNSSTANSTTAKSNSGISEATETILSKLRLCQYRHDTETSSSSSQSSSSSSRSSTDVVIDLRRYITEKGSGTGKGGYDKNLSLVDVFHDGRPTDVVQHTGQLHQFHAKQTKQTRACVVHLVSEAKAVFQQKTDLLWRIAVGDSLDMDQTHLVIGPVSGRAGHHCDLTAEAFVKFRCEQMTDASIMKYGEEVKGRDWETTLSGMTTASIAFEMLNTASRSTVKLDLSDETRLGGENRAGAFVMYNCARVATLFKHFNESVDKSFYPPLPSIEDIDFEHLREPEEWEILFNYIYTFPDIVAQCVEKMHASPTDIHARIHTHKISIFLINFSRCLSAYYSRVHILGDGRPHLFPAMFARLYLMRAAHQCLQNGLHLMGIQPYSQL